MEAPGMAGAWLGWRETRSAAESKLAAGGDGRGGGGGALSPVGSFVPAAADAPGTGCSIVYHLVSPFLLP